MFTTDFATDELSPTVTAGTITGVGGATRDRVASALATIGGSRVGRTPRARISSKLESIRRIRPEEATVGIDPFVAVDRGAAPRTKLGTPPAPSWRADRPGDLPGRQPSGVLLGNPGPDLGFALHLAERWRDRLALGHHEHPDDVLAAAAEIGMRRAASFGRAPTGPDVELGLTLLGALSSGAPPGLVDWRRRHVHGAAHHYVERRALVDRLDADIVRAPMPLPNDVLLDWEQWWNTADADLAAHEDGD